ncbi:hypothetical protein ACI2K4_18765 [Micromonospora sp. NPDC050397]|uniref:hypothetical protein n=1 Tax=Micromonospora sp. NPDC050397 TaxID=3364279 RepID=UPI00384C1E30
MTRNWLGFRLQHPSWLSDEDADALALNDILPSLARRLRAADLDARWQFRRHDGPDADTTTVWFQSTAAVLDKVEQWLRRRMEEDRWLVVEAPPRPGAELPPGSVDTQLGETLADLSSDLALDLLATGPLDPADQLRVASLHLRTTSELVPESDRASFLFLGWQHWSRQLTPAHRVRLGAQADLIAPDVLDLTAETARQWRWRELWPPYGTALRAVVEEHRAQDCPLLNYLLFDHVERTHHRLGLPLEVTAVAAGALRAAARIDRLDRQLLGLDQLVVAVPGTRPAG